MLLFQAVKPALLEWCVEWLLYVILSSIKLIQRNAQPWWNFIRISFTKWEPYGLLLLIEHWVGSSSRTKSWTDTKSGFLQRVSFSNGCRGRRHWHSRIPSTVTSVVTKQASSFPSASTSWMISRSSGWSGCWYTLQREQRRHGDSFHWQASPS